MTEFTFATATSIRFGVGVAAELPHHSRRLGERPFVLTGRNTHRHAEVLRDISDVGSFALSGEPSFDDARAAVGAAREAGADHIIGIGGGAVVDLAKVVAALAAGDTDPMDHAEVIGGGHPLPHASLPFLALPTTSGTGSEVTANAVLTSVEHRVKVSLRGPSMLATVALVDPALTVSCPPLVTAQSGMDALTQCLEPLTSRFANPMVDALATSGLRAAARGLARAVAEGEDLEARTDMAYCSLMGGLSLANAKLGAVHGFAGPLGGVTGAPHGAVCAALLRVVTRTNIHAMSTREPGNPALQKYVVAAEALTGRPQDADPERVGETLDAWLEDLKESLQLPGLAELGLAESDHDAVADAAMKGSSMKGNPITLTRDELLAILRDAA
ncbi:iron-containing alcohol dehydrogenase [Tessaracoccus sp. G1721]